MASDARVVTLAFGVRSSRCKYCASLPRKSPAVFALALLCGKWEATTKTSRLKWSRWPGLWIPKSIDCGCFGWKGSGLGLGSGSGSGSGRCSGILVDAKTRVEVLVGRWRGEAKPCIAEVGVEQE